ncbi:E3 ubiquitin-protein ligase SINAT5-like [Heracleum sosnowskyi]|uniref:E3 ubiquitin-protein ligase SINAT5-like n=1 Tax=Heracleum sosnowskyi TaxID=360622 RepID=A0AAD8HFL2_9APIA|nr:E3 ubiquitin-protein ligase SINAT5-like [Heracleum sosnowskyi]
MDIDNIECVSSSDGIEDDEFHHHHHHPNHRHQQYPLKSHNKNIIIGSVVPRIAPATSVHELLECPVCTNSMYPPIHQVFFSCVRLVKMERWKIGMMVCEKSSEVEVKIVKQC